MGMAIISPWFFCHVGDMYEVFLRTCQCKRTSTNGVGSDSPAGHVHEQDLLCTRINILVGIDNANTNLKLKKHTYYYKKYPFPNSIFDYLNIC